jgi:hypothetical protein
VAAALPVIAVVATVAGTAVSVYGAMQTAQAQSAANAAKAQQDRNNAILAENAANDAKARGDVAAQQKAAQTNQLIGQQRAALAANGVDPNQGTAVDLQSDAAGNGELDQLTIHANAAREAAGYNAQGANYSSQAAVDEASSQNALSAGSLSAVSTIIGGAGSVAGQWYDYSYGTRKSSV